MISLDGIPPNQTDTWEITAIIDTALCVGAGGSSGSLADKPIVRNAQGQLIIPASQIKGRLRHECEKLASALGWEIFYAPVATELCPNQEQLKKRFQKIYGLENLPLDENLEWNLFQEIYTVTGYKGFHCIVSQIFGNPILPSRVIVEDFICSVPADELPEVLRPGVTINRRRRTAEETKLYLLETSPANAQLKFEGKIHLLPKFSSICPDLAKLLIFSGLHHIYALGGSKSTGLGWLHWQNLPKFTIDESTWSNLAAKQFLETIKGKRENRVGWVEERNPTLNREEP
ncbi:MULTISPECIES: RAMP superfamily CRISPR-associated protein [Nostocales]|uniref:CRISPR-associated protein Csm3 n=3 Tax=Nostocales TaxID=1161 RepID=A0A8S9T941_9CYAN|nr:RAMP superfamily CRISPR-associated protein [Tolypothrix bouteillei]KAF3889081.1 CRISPR-associated protein Csm3 [Tolypothrix bouteillei VB521301]